MLGAFSSAGLIDRVVAFVAPVLVGGRDAPGPLGDRGVATIAEAYRLRRVTIRQLDHDLLISGDVEGSAGGQAC